jgi:flagellar protein FlaI
MSQDDTPTSPESETSQSEDSDPDLGDLFGESTENDADSSESRPSDTAESDSDSEDDSGDYLFNFDESQEGDGDDQEGDGDDQDMEPELVESSDPAQPDGDDEQMNDPAGDSPVVGGEEVPTAHGISAQRSWQPDAQADDDDFFVTDDGNRTLVGPEDLKWTVPDVDAVDMEELDRYWLDKPNSFCVVYHSKSENERLYYVVEPYLSEWERQLKAFFDEQLRANMDYASISLGSDKTSQQDIILETFYDLLDRYSLIRSGDFGGSGSIFTPAVDWFVDAVKGRADSRREQSDDLVAPPSPGDTSTAGPTGPDVHEETPSNRLSPRQVDKLTYYLIRDSVGWDKIEGLKHDGQLEDINCDGPDVEVFIDHGEHNQLITNVTFTEHELDRFVEKLANRAGKGISRRQPNVDAILPNGSRASLTLGKETTTGGSAFTIRMFRDVPFTPVDLIAWNTYDLDQMAYLWLCIESGKSFIFAGGTSSGKTTTQNALSLFIPGAKQKIVSIEDTPELNLPQKNWIQHTTRDGFTEDGSDAIEEMDLLETALRENPDYIVVGEVRGEEGSVMFQVMSSGHACFTTFHANDPGQVIKRFTSSDIGVSREFFNELDGIVNQELVRVDGQKVRRNTRITEIGRYDEESNTVNRTGIFDWNPHTDSFVQSAPSTLLEEIRNRRGWTMARLEWELLKRQTVLSYLIKNEITKYKHVASVIQATLSEEVSILKEIGRGTLEERLDELSEMRSVDFDVDAEDEESVPRPPISDEVTKEADATLEDARPYLEMLIEETGQKAVTSGSDPGEVVAAADFLPELEAAEVTDRLSSTDSLDIEWASKKVGDGQLEDTTGLDDGSDVMGGSDGPDGITFDDLGPDARDIIKQLEGVTIEPGPAEEVPRDGEPSEMSRGETERPSGDNAEASRTSSNGTSPSDGIDDGEQVSGNEETNGTLGETPSDVASERSLGESDHSTAGAGPNSTANPESQADVSEAGKVDPTNPDEGGGPDAVETGDAGEQTGSESEPVATPLDETAPEADGGSTQDGASAEQDDTIVEDTSSLEFEFGDDGSEGDASESLEWPEEGNGSGDDAGNEHEVEGTAGDGEDATADDSDADSADSPGFDVKHSGEKANEFETSTIGGDDGTDDTMVSVDLDTESVSEGDSEDIAPTIELQDGSEETADAGPEVNSADSASSEGDGPAPASGVQPSSDSAGSKDSKTGEDSSPAAPVDTDPDPGSFHEPSSPPDAEDGSTKESDSTPAVEADVDAATDGSTTAPPSTDGPSSETAAEPGGDSEVPESLPRKSASREFESGPEFVQEDDSETGRPADGAGDVAGEATDDEPTPELGATAASFGTGVGESDGGDTESTEGPSEKESVSGGTSTAASFDDVLDDGADSSGQPAPNSNDSSSEVTAEESADESPDPAFAASFVKTPDSGGPEEDGTAREDAATDSTEGTTQERESSENNDEKGTEDDPETLDDLLGKLQDDEAEGGE